MPLQKVFHIIGFNINIVLLLEYLQYCNNNVHISMFDLIIMSNKQTCTSVSIVQWSNMQKMNKNQASNRFDANKKKVITFLFFSQ